MAEKDNSITVDDIALHFASAYISSNGPPRVLPATVQRPNIKGAHVNIHDFVRVQQNGGDINACKFRSYRALRLDIQNNPSRRFPLWKAKASEFLSVMLINI